MGQGSETVNRAELEQVIQTLTDLGFKVEWADANAETFLVRCIAARSS
jgi:hypothetical protein